MPVLVQKRHLSFIRISQRIRKLLTLQLLSVTNDFKNTLL